MGSGYPDAVWPANVASEGDRIKCAAARLRGPEGQDRAVRIDKNEVKKRMSRLHGGNVISLWQNHAIEDACIARHSSGVIYLTEENELQGDGQVLLRLADVLESFPTNGPAPTEEQATQWLTESGRINL